MSEDDISPGSWLQSVIDVLKGKNPNLPFKVISTRSLETFPPHDIVRVLNGNDGSVWEFTCRVERGPA